MTRTVVRSAPNSNIRRALQERYGSACAICGNDTVPLQIAHIVSLMDGGTDNIENFLLLCPNCHRLMDSYLPREIEFVKFITELLKSNPNFRNVVNEQSFGHPYRADILVERKQNPIWQGIVIECKNYSALSPERADAVVNQLLRYRQFIEGNRLALAFPGRVTNKVKERLECEDIEIWDIDYISRVFNEQIKQVNHPYFSVLFHHFASNRRKREGELFLSELKSCSPGNQEWVVYQKLIGRILEFLFCPPLESPMSEISDISGVNRRDIILSNYASEGFWKFLRDRYLADYIVVDAKNYNYKVKKTQVLQIANYLKSHGAGLFGLIVCRNGGDAGCNHILREQWMVHKKMILVLNDEDVEAMLLAKLSGGNPEDIISQKIEKFRLSM